MSFDTSCLYSVVKNTSNKRRVFGFLPPHGRELDADEEFVSFGNIVDNLGGNRGSEPSVKRRDQVAFERAIADGDLKIMSTPAVILRDIDDNSGLTVKMLQLNAGVLEDVDPCWLNSVG